MIYVVNNLPQGEVGWLGLYVERLAALAPGKGIVIDHHRVASPERLKGFPITHILLGGGHRWAQYDMSEFSGVLDIIRQTQIPTLGICAGHQLIGLAADAPVALMSDSPGASSESGFMEVRIVKRDRLLDGLGDRIVVHEGHSEEIQAVPPGFDLLGTRDTCHVQIIKAHGRPVYGVQFHPEKYDDEHPDGRRILSNFLAM